MFKKIKDLIKAYEYSWICDCKMCKLLRFIKVDKFIKVK